MDKRDLLIKTATLLFSERGFENTPISLVCERANVSKGLISHHFKSKNGLLREIFAKTTRLIASINEQKPSPGSAKELLRTRLESFFTELQANKLLFQFNLSVMVQPGTRAILSDLIEERSTLIFKATKDIFSEIYPSEGKVRSHLFIAELDGIAVNYLLGTFTDYPLDEIKTQLIEKYTQ